MKVKKSELKKMYSQAKSFSQLLTSTPDIVKVLTDESLTDDQEIELTDDQAKAIGLVSKQQGGIEDYLNDKFKK